MWCVSLEPQAEKNLEMGQPSGPPPPFLSPPPPPPSLPSLPVIQAFANDAAGCQVRCTFCKMILTVGTGLTEFVCPKCDLPRMLPPELFPTPQQQQRTGLCRWNEKKMKMGPPKLSIGAPHPDPVVETSSLSAVQPAGPTTYNLSIKDDLEISKALSCSQIETLVYACQRHLQHLSSGARAGFFIGDGAGVGKGRTIAGLIWENWHHKRRKTLWISVGSDLKFDARRDLDDVGASCIEVHALNKLPYSKLDSKSVGISEGVIFLTYSSLIASSEKGRTRLQQLVQWCGPEYDGLIIVDECHNVKNLVSEVGGQPTRAGKAVLEIQAQLLQARVIYCSATGGSEPRNMGYMVRLGLWGAGTSFLSFRDFLGAMEKAGVVALELVARDMKARGMYVCRALSYKGAELEVVEVPLEAKMMVNLTKNAANKEARVRDMETQLVQSKASHTRVCQVNLTKNAANKEAQVRDLETQLVRSQASRTRICQVNLTKNAAYKEARLRDLESQHVNLTKNAANKEARVRDLEKIKRKGKEILKRHNSRGNDVIKIKSDDYIGLRNDLMELGAEIYATSALVEKRWNESSSSLKWNKDRVRELESELASLEQELLSGKDASATIERQFSSEISGLMELVELYKKSSEKWAKKARELEGMVTALETHLVQVEDDYKQRLENEALSRKEIEKELLSGKDVAAIIERQFLSEISRLTELVELYKKSSEKWSKKARDLEGMVTALETHLVQVEDDYKQRLENEALGRKEIEKELLSGKDVAAIIERQFSSEISRLTELVELYKESSQEWSKKARELEGMITALESHLVQVQDDYKQRLENEAIARKETEKEVDRWKEKFVKCAAELESFNIKDNMIQESLKKAQEKARVQVNNLEEELGKSRGGVEEGGSKGKNALPQKKATWSEEEVQALTAGVEKYGTGLWKQILNDAEFASSLKNRSNINLKDKWRNMSKNSS